MTVRVIKNAGFCFGVSRALELLNSEIQKGSENLYTLGEIIHNPDIIKDVTDAGVRIINDVNSLVCGDRLVVRAHGATVAEAERLGNAGVCVIDATCPFVSKIHEIVKKCSEKGDVILIGGNGIHPEAVSYTHLYSFLN